jgi:acyl-CoA synthetase (AMP-forming)/AMP-acid ligase II
MNISDLFEQWQTLGAFNNTLSDDHQQISYQKAYLRISVYRDWLASGTFTQPMAFYCDQSVEHLLMLIALVSSELNFVLLPATPTDLDRELYGDQLTLQPQFSDTLQHIQLTKQAHSQTIATPGTIYFKTSGSLGTPKLVVHQRSQLIANARNVLTRLPLNAARRVLIPVPMHHMYGFGAALWPSLLVGASIHLTRNLNILKFKAVERQFAPNVAYLTPPTVGALLLRPGKPSQYDFIVSAGDCFAHQKFEQAEAKFGRVFNLYGSTELGVIAIGEMKNQGETVDDRVTPLPEVKIKIQSGQISVNHPYGFEYYLHQQLCNEPREAFFDTGDLVRSDATNGFSVIGRAKLSINREGRLIAFSELESQIKQHQHIKDVALVKGPKDSKGHTIIAIVESATELTPDELRRQLSKVLPLYATPSQIIIEPQLPRLGSGKINRKIIAQSYEETQV